MSRDHHHHSRSHDHSRSASNQAGGTAARAEGIFDPQTYSEQEPFQEPTSELTYLDAAGHAIVVEVFALRAHATRQVQRCAFGVFFGQNSAHNRYGVLPRIRDLPETADLLYACSIAAELVGAVIRERDTVSARRVREDPLRHVVFKVVDKYAAARVLAALKHGRTAMHRRRNRMPDYETSVRQRFEFAFDALDSAPIRVEFWTFDSLDEDPVKHAAGLARIIIRPTERTSLVGDMRVSGPLEPPGSNIVDSGFGSYYAESIAAEISDTVTTDTRQARVEPHPYGDIGDSRPPRESDGEEIARENWTEETSNFYIQAPD
ncbi:hypothetical protein PVAG01_10477 [Phlyctema vagabunda]|uniref:Uncharacterized protein n=1 Tax=Phlyctema vagabunda TaxID=108571 RepID=A0ABR4P6P2_9HELO